MNSSLLPRAVAFLALAGFGACQKGDAPAPAAPDVTAAAPESAPPPAPKSFELTLKREGRSVTATGAGPAGVAEAIRTAVGKYPDCAADGVSVTAEELASTTIEVAALPLETAMKALCAAPAGQFVLNSEGRVMRGTFDLFDRHERARFRPSLPEGAVDGWVVDIAWAPDPAAIPSGYGRLRVVAVPGQEHTQNQPSVLKPVLDGAPLDEALRPGWDGLVKPGIYAASNGDHVAIREGHVSVFMPGNPAGLVIAGLRFPLDAVVPVGPRHGKDALRFDSPESEVKCLNGASGQPCYGPRYARPGEKIETNDLSGLRLHLQQVVLHSDLAEDTARDFRNMIARALSFHLGIDFDGTIHQALDLVHTAYHAGEANNQGIGIDLNNLMPNLLKKPDAPAYPPKHPRAAEMAQHPRPLSEPMTINHAKVQSFGYTEAQYQALLAVGRLLLRVFPGLEGTFPKADDGSVVATVLEKPDAFRGFIAHHHWEAQRWDPGPGFDWQRVEAGLR